MERIKSETNYANTQHSIHMAQLYITSMHSYSHLVKQLSFQGCNAVDQLVKLN